MRLLLIRHGQTPNNVAGALDTALPGAGLTELGHAQAAALPGALADEAIAGVYASPLVRTQLTATPLSQERGLEVVVRPGLEEISAGALEMRSDEEAVAAYLEAVSSWIHGDLGHRMPGGETGHDFRDRYDGAVATLAREHRDDATLTVVSHGAAIRVYATLAAGLEPDEVATRYLMNTGMVALEGDPDAGWRLAHWSSEPLGGMQLGDQRAHDVTGESVEEAQQEAEQEAEQEAVER